MHPHEQETLMRVIAGSARSLQLKSLPGMDTRPTVDKYKETLFNVLSNYIPDCTFLDLFSGTGNIGIEALSRGAKEAILVENNKKAVKIIEENLKHTHLTEGAKIMETDVFYALALLEKHDPFDIVFMDPPYNKEYEKRVLEVLSTASYVDEYTIIIVEASLDTDLSYLDELNFECYKEKLYKTNKHLFIRKKEEL